MQQIWLGYRTIDSDPLGSNKPYNHTIAPHKYAIGYLVCKHVCCVSMVVITHEEAQVRFVVKGWYHVSIRGCLYWQYLVAGQKLDLHGNLPNAWEISRPPLGGQNSK